MMRLGVGEHGDGAMVLDAAEKMRAGVREKRVSLGVSEQGEAGAEFLRVQQAEKGRRRAILGYGEVKAVHGP